MPHSQSFDAIILKTYDVGEADRFCILFTREKGRLTARAAGARRTGSRLGGALLPFRRVTVQMKEGGAGWIVAGAVTVDHPSPFTLSAFAALEEGIEVLMKLVQHEGELPEIYDATASFIAMPSPGVLAYSVCLLHHLGLLPEERELTAMFGLTREDHAYVEACRRGVLNSAKKADVSLLEQAALHLLSLTLTSPLRAPAVSGMLR